MSHTRLAICLGIAMLATSGFASAQTTALDKSFERAERLSTEQKSRDAVRDVARIKQVLELALQRLAEARSDKDMAALTCVNDKLSAIKGLLKIAEQAEVSLREAVARGDQELINHEYTKISIAGVRAENFRVEVSGCIGELSGYTGDTIVEKVVDEEIRNDQPADREAVAFSPIDLNRPPPVSGDE